MKSVHRRHILTVLYSAAVAVVLLEIFLRLFDPLGIRYYFDANAYFSRAMVDDPDYAYIHRPGLAAEMQGVDVEIDSEGLRWPEFPVDVPAGEKRLLFLGDSVVFGWGVAQDSIFPARVQRRLRQGHPDWGVIAAGVGSWNTRTEYEWLRDRGVDYGLDAVVLVAVPNDVEPKLDGRTDVDKADLRAQLEGDAPPGPVARVAGKLERGAVRVSYVAATVRHLFRAASGGSRLEVLYGPDSPAWRDARDALDGIVTLCRERGIELVVFLWGDGSTPLSRVFLDAYGGYLNDTGVGYHTFPPELYSPRYRNSLVDPHPNASGHRLMADAIMGTLAEKPAGEAR